MQPFLVTGAAGRHGGTGAFVARLLLAQGQPVRVLVRKVDDRVTPLRQLGAEVATGDLRDHRSLGPALDQVRVAYFTWPVAAGIVDAAAGFAAAAKKAGLQRVVVMSMGAAHAESPSALGRAQWLAEQVLEWAGFACLQLRIAAFFYENIELLHGADLAHGGTVRSSFGDVATQWLSGEDAAKVAVAALLHPERFANGPAFYPGGHAYSYADVARIVGQHLGRPLRHETISKEAWREHLVDLARTDDRISADMAAHISTLGAALREPRPPNDLFERLTGEKPTTLEDALRAGRLSRLGRSP